MRILLEMHPSKMPQVHASRNTAVLRRAGIDNFLKSFYSRAGSPTITSIEEPSGAPAADEGTMTTPQEGQEAESNGVIASYTEGEAAPDQGHEVCVC